jgi:hypothetical protein
MTMSANRVSTIWALPLYLINARCGCYCDIWGFGYFDTLKCSWKRKYSIVVRICRYWQGSCHGNISCWSAYESYQLLVDRCLQSTTTWITQHIRLKVVDTLLTLIFKMRHRACCFLFYPYMQPSLWVYITQTKSLFKYLTYKIKSYCLVLAMVPFSDRLYNSGYMNTRPQAVGCGFVQNGSFN